MAVRFARMVENGDVLLHRLNGGEIILTPDEVHLIAVTVAAGMRPLVDSLKTLGVWKDTGCPVPITKPQPMGNAAVRGGTD